MRAFEIKEYALCTVIRGPDRVNMMLVFKSEDSSDEERIIGLGDFGAIRNRKRWAQDSLTIFKKKQI